jgi:hypothetical protein
LCLSGLDPETNEEFLKYGCNAVWIFLTPIKSLFPIFKVESWSTMKAFGKTGFFSNFSRTDWTGMYSSFSTTVVSTFYF